MSPKERLENEVGRLNVESEQLFDIVSDRPEDPDTAREAVIGSVERIRKHCDAVERIVR